MASEFFHRVLEMNHIERGKRSFHAFVPVLAACALTGLLFVVNRQESEYDWSVAIGIERGDTLCHA